MSFAGKLSSLGLCSRIGDQTLAILWWNQWYLSLDTFYPGFSPFLA
jgi:hypothetical protein